MNALAGLYLSRRSRCGAHELRLFFSHFNINAADRVYYSLKHIESDEHIVVYLDIVVIFYSVHDKLRSAVRAGGVELVIRLCRRNNSPCIAQERSQLYLLVVAVYRHHKHGIGTQRSIRA